MKYFKMILNTTSNCHGTTLSGKMSIIVLNLLSLDARENAE